MKMNIHDVKVEDRARVTNLDHVKELAESIKEFGLIQPIVVSTDGRLIAGGHRLAAFELLAEEDELYSHIPCIHFETYLIAEGKIAEGEVISDLKLKVLELEENVKRLDMSWTEQTIALAKYHKIALREAVDEGKKWTQEMTGRLVGISQAQVSIVLTVARELLRDEESELWNQTSLKEAARWLADKELTKANEELTKRQEANRDKRLKEAKKKLLEQGADNALLLPSNKNSTEAKEPKSVGDMLLEQSSEEEQEGWTLETIKQLIVTGETAAEYSLVVFNPRYEFDIMLIEEVWEMTKEVSAVLAWSDIYNYSEQSDSILTDTPWTTAEVPFYWCSRDDQAEGLPDSTFIGVLLGKKTVPIKNKPDANSVFGSEKSLAAWLKKHLLRDEQKVLVVNYNEEMQGLVKYFIESGHEVELLEHEDLSNDILEELSNSMNEQEGFSNVNNLFDKVL